MSNTQIAVVKLRKVTDEYQNKLLSKYEDIKHFLQHNHNYYFLYKDVLYHKNIEWINDYACSYTITSEDKDFDYCMFFVYYDGGTYPDELIEEELYNQTKRKND